MLGGASGTPLLPLIVTSEARFTIDRDGNVWGTNSLHPLSDGTERLVAARIRFGEPVAGQRLVAHLSDVVVLPSSTSLWALPIDLLRGFVRICRCARRAGGVWITMPGVVGAAGYLAARVWRLGLVVSVVGDPVGAAQRGVVRHPLRPLARALMPRLVADACRHADVVRYVTSTTLQNSYPAGPRATSFGLSDVRVDRVLGPRSAARSVEPLVVTVASLDQPYKGVDTLIRALAIARRRIPGARLLVIGGGRHLGEYKDLARRLLVEGYEFTGPLPDSVAVRERLVPADVFVLASLTEGLPRAMIEAMSVGLPSIGTDVGGIAELLPRQELVRPGDPERLANAIAHVLSSDDVYADRARWSVRMASSFLPAETGQVRSEFLQAVQTLQQQKSSRIESGRG